MSVVVSVWLEELGKWKEVLTEKWWVSFRANSIVFDQETKPQRSVIDL